jgi:hypothetical protein
MANFCPNCGAAAGTGSFCVSCGKPLAGVQPPGPAPALPAKSKGGSALKIILITLALIAMVGFAAVVGLFYYAKSRVNARLAELKQRTGIDLPAAMQGTRESNAVRSNLDGCVLMTRSEAEQILGFTIMRSDGMRRPDANQEHCDYYASPNALEEIRGKTADRFNKPADTNRSLDVSLAQAEQLTKGMVAGVNDGSAPILQISVQRGDAKAASLGLTAASRLLGGKAEKLPGPWDEAVFGPMYSTLMVRKGDNGVLIDLRQVPNGREKGLAMAHVIAPRL